MKLRRPCEHKLYDDHELAGSEPWRCPGGEFLPEDALADIAWQLNEAVSLLREARFQVADALGEEIDEGLPAMQSALKLAADQVGEPG